MSDDNNLKPTYCGAAEVAACCQSEAKTGGCCGSSSSTSTETPSQSLEAGTLKIEVVGPGCASCQQLHEITKRAVVDMEQKTSVVYLSGKDGMARMMELGMMSAPILVVDNKIALVGYSPSVQKIRNAILETADRPRM